MSLKQIADDTSAVLAQVSTLRADLSGKLLRGAATARELTYLDTGLRNAHEDLRSVRASLDALVVEDCMVGEHPADLLEAESQARELRRGSLALEARLLESRAVTTEMLAGVALRVVYAQDGDTLQSIAGRELGDWRAWPKLLEANPGLVPGALTPGAQIQIPKPR